MTDRIPGAPGQYKAAVTEEELLKMQAGEPFTITITRDDQPIEEGTPYSKAAVLPDELAKRICPDKENPTPADALAALLPLLGGKMAGNIDMDGNRVTGLQHPEGESDAVNWGRVMNALFENTQWITNKTVNALYPTGFYRVAIEAALLAEMGWPFSQEGGTMLALTGGDDFGIQIAFSYNGYAMIRSYWYEVWHQWISIT